MTDQAPRPPRRPALLAGVLVSFAFSLAILGLAVLYVFDAFAGRAVFTCQTYNTPPWGIFDVLGCGVAFVLGSILTERRKTAGRRLDLAHAKQSLAVRVALPAFVLCLVLFLGYETLAYTRPDRWQPVTTYIRCTVVNAPTIPVLVSLAVSFLLGQWFWHPLARGKAGA